MSNLSLAKAALRALREHGYAVAFFTPEQLQGVDPKYVENQLVGAGWETINVHGLQEYRVTYYEEDPSERIFYECQAMNSNHVVEQFEDEYPTARILAIELQD